VSEVYYHSWINRLKTYMKKNRLPKNISVYMMDLLLNFRTGRWAVWWWWWWWWRWPQW